MRTEIGSEFFDIPKYSGGQTDNLPADNNAYFLSGRTALNAIVEDAINTFSITSALLPSYCCDSMITPFLRHNISVRFYDVMVLESGLLKATLPSPQKDELLYVMKYFGDSSLFIDSSRWQVTLEDLTHIAFNKNYSSGCTYTYTSFRKWFAVDGIATAYKNDSPLLFQKSTNNNTNNTYQTLRNNGFNQKKKYMSGEAIEKSIFLNMFSEAEEILDEDYENFQASQDAIIALKGALENKSEIISKRRTNALTLIKGLKSIPQITVFCKFESVDSCPLFVPICVDASIRNSLRKHLIDNDIYCPVHWPLTDEHEGISDEARSIYNQELSLICDQRYDDKDMQKIIETIKNFFA